MRISWEEKISFSVILVILTCSGCSSESWCPVGIHVHHELKDYTTHDLNGVLCSESCLIMKNFTVKASGDALIAAFCVPSSKCKNAQPCSDIATYLADLKNTTRLDRCSSLCCNGEASCRKAMKIEQTFPNPTCKRDVSLAKALDPGRNCRKKCKRQRDCKGRLKRCACDDWCGLSCYNPNFVCQLPPVRKPMTVEFYGRKSLIQYGCKDGYFLGGNSIRKCRSDRKFSGRSPTCKAGCKPPEPQVKNSIAIATEQGYGVGEEVQFICHHGFHLNGNAKVICHIDGSWSAQTFKCERNVCGTPPRIVVNNVSPDPPVVFTDASGYLIARYRCVEGFKVRSGSTTAFCNSPSGTWSSATLVCGREIRCREIRSTPTLKVTLSKNGKRASFRCKAGWKLSGPETLRCTARGWTGRVPSCVEEYCTYNDYHLQPGVTTFSSGFYQIHYRVGDELVLRCNTTEVATLRCLADSVWSDDIGSIECPKDAICTINKLLLQKDVELKQYRDKYALGEKVTFWCQNEEILTIECLENSLWSKDYKTLKCERDQCPEIDESGGLTVRYVGKRTVGFIAFVQCGRNRRMLQCSPGLLWRPPPPICSDDSCRLPAISEQLVITDPASTLREDFASGTTITFACKNPLMSLRGQPQLKCVSGKWTAKAPTCGCPDFANTPAHLQVTMRNRGAVAQFRCDIGYDLIGSFNAKCLGTGKWSRSAPRCLESGCEIDTFLLHEGVRVVNHGTRGILKFPYGKKVELTCNGQVVEEIVCGKKSLWSKDYVDVPCKHLELSKTSVVTSPTKRPKGTPTKKPISASAKKPKITVANKLDMSCNCSCGTAGDTFHIEEEHVLGKVVGGANALPHAWPWQAVILIKRKSGNETITSVHGGGTLISQKWILTAAHVFEYERRRKEKWHKSFVFGLGTHNIESLATLNGHEEFYVAATIKVHKKFDLFTMANDIALVRVGQYFDMTRNQEIQSAKSGTVAFSRYIRPVCLPCMKSCTAATLRKEDFDAGLCSKATNIYKQTRPDYKKVFKAVVTGYGHTEARSPDDGTAIETATILQQAALTIRNPRKCTNDLEKMRKSFSRVPENVDGTICASSGRKIDSCRGDSGGPLMRKIKTKPGMCWYQVGIVSWGIGCATRVNGQIYPGFYADITYYLPWIMDIVSSTP